MPEHAPAPGLVLAHAMRAARIPARRTPTAPVLWRWLGRRWLMAGLAVLALLPLLVPSVHAATGPVTAAATEAVPAVADPALEARMLRIAAELRCLVCQNQTIADSHADLAVDLRQQVREMLHAGKTDPQIIDYMTARYGDFVLYRPPFKTTTLLLWVGPALFLLIGVGVLAVVLRRRNRLPPEQFEPDVQEEEDSAAPAPRR